MSGQSVKHLTGKDYRVIYGWLLALTAFEISMVMLGWPKTALGILLVATALAKALLIALYFMHLKFDHPAVWLLPGIPVALGLVFVLALFPDLVWHLVHRM